MKYAIKLLIITAFVMLISWQVLSLAATPPFDYAKYVKRIDRVEAKLIASNYAEAHVLLLSVEEEDKEKAKSILNQMIEEYEKLKHNTHLQQGVLEEMAVLSYKTGNYEEACIKAEDVLKEYPNSLPGSTVLAMCYHLKASIYAQQEEYDLALLEYENILEYPIAPGIEGFANFFIGRMYEKKGDKQSASIYYNTVVDNSSELGWKKRALERLERVNNET